MVGSEVRHHGTAKLREQPDGGLLDKLVFAVGVGHGCSMTTALKLTALVGRAASTSDNSARLTSAARREEKSESSGESGSRRR